MVHSPRSQARNARPRLSTKSFWLLKSIPDAKALHSAGPQVRGRYVSHPHPHALTWRGLKGYSLYLSAGSGAGPVWQSWEALRVCSTPHFTDEEPEAREGGSISTSDSSVAEMPACVRSVSGAEDSDC